jgi:hypothetical protein
LVDTKLLCAILKLAYIMARRKVGKTAKRLAINFVEYE